MTINWDAVGAIGTCLGAIATFAAVIVSLRLARKDGDKLNVFAGILGIAPANPIVYFVSLMVKNLSPRILRVEGFYLRIGFFRKKDYVITSNYARLDSKQFPANLDYGEYAEKNYDLDAFDKAMLHAFFEPVGLDKYLPFKLYLKSARISANSPSKTFKTALHPDLQKHIIKRWEEQKIKPKNTENTPN